MKSFLGLICFIVILALLLYLGSLVIEYDNKRKDRIQTSFDKIFDICRWILYIPLGLFSGLIFGIVFNFLFVNKFDRVLSELMARLISIYFMGFCFYVIIPTLNKIKKIQGAAITILIMEVLAIVVFLFYDGNMNKKFILDVITTIVAFIGSIYFIMNPEDISKN